MVKGGLIHAVSEDLICAISWYLIHVVGRVILCGRQGLICVVSRYLFVW